MVKLSWALKRIFYQFPYLRFLSEENGESRSSYFSGYTVYLGLAKKNYYSGNSEIFCFVPVSLYTLCGRLLESGEKND